MRHRSDLLFLILVSSYSTVFNSAVSLQCSDPYNESADVTCSRPTPEAFNAGRKLFFNFEESRALGADVDLNEREMKANQIIMSMKHKEYEEGLAVPHLFAPSQHIFKVLKKIRSSPLFEYLSMMPKGAVLHAHDTALCSTKFLIKLTYRSKLWVCQTEGELKVSAFRFSNQKPDAYIKDVQCDWMLMQDLRTIHGAQKVDQYLRDRFSLYPRKKYLDNNEVWENFSSIFRLLGGLLYYAPVWADYYYNALSEFYIDGVQYLEFRTTLPRLYDLQSNAYTELYTVQIYKNTLDKFMANNPGFIGSKFIYAPSRRADNARLDNYIKLAIELKQKYPDFFAGFDLVGQEELGRPLKDFVPQLLSMPENIDFYFHAGETNWYGSSVDENLIDAILLGTKRIGHGFSLLKHPLVLDMIKERNIAIEVNPISNQVLLLVSDYRNHPCAHFFSDNYPVVISSDDPSFWKATPLSHDFYIAFLGIASAHADIRLLKKLATNSIEYSALNASQKVDAMNAWQLKWNDFIDLVVERDAAPADLSTHRLDGYMDNKIDSES